MSTASPTALPRSEPASPALLRSPTLQLVNPVARDFAPFIFGNATECDRVIEEGSASGQHLVLCGAGPTLREHADEWCAKGDQVWGCNSAAIYLYDHGYPVTHAFTVDQTPDMLAEWQSAPPLEYLVSSTIHPHLTRYLKHKHGRRLTWFHNYVGVKERPVHVMDAEGVERVISYEDWLYHKFYPPTVACGSGLNSVTRAVDAARYMGFDRVTVLGADCAMRASSRRPPQPAPVHPNSPNFPAYQQDVARWTKKLTRWLRQNVTMHADGSNALRSGATPLVLDAEIDGVYWVTKPDMAITAQWLTRMAWAWPDHLQIVGDTLPNAFASKDEAFLARLPNFEANGQLANIPVIGEW